jgi:hypothetical protein
MEVSHASTEDAPRLVQIFSEAYKDDARTYFLYASMEHASTSFNASLYRVLSSMTSEYPRQILKITELKTRTIVGFLDYFRPERKPSHGLPVAGWGD